MSIGVRATVVVDLRVKNELDPGIDVDRLDRRALEVLERVPDGAHVVIQVGTREMIMSGALRALRTAAERLDLEIWAQDDLAVRRWHAAILTGELR